MAKENRYDSIAVNPAAMPYELRLHNYDDSLKRCVTGSADCFAHYNGSMAKRPGRQQWAPLQSTIKPVRIWEYETLPATDGTVYRFALMSGYNTSTSKYVLYYKIIFTGYSVATAWTSVGSLRDVDSSTQPHEVVFSRGKAYVLGFPSTTEKLGTIIVDGTGGTITTTPWGLLGPQTPARITGKITKLNGAISATDTTITVDSTTGFTSPIWIGTERITYGGTTATTFTSCVRGTSGTAAQAHGDNTAVLYHDWSASDHAVNVNRGWQYSYAYVSITGQISNRADIESNPDFLPSNTGPFFDLIPKFTYIVDTGFDSTNYPYVNFYRTTDGGGTFFLLEQLANAGPGTYTYSDDSLGTGASGTTYNDPLPDAQLTSPGPTLTSNSPPPRVNPPGVTGTTTPLASNLYSSETYASRLWFAIGNYLYYSCNEDLIVGNREECFPSGDFGNFFVLNFQIVGLRATSTALYIVTTQELLKLTGATKDTFSVIRIDTVGGFVGNSGITSCRDTVAYVTNNRQVALVQNDKAVIISDPLSEEFKNTLPTSTSYIPYLSYYRDINYELIILGINNYDETLGADSYGVWWIYDMKKSETANYNWWWPPWNTQSTVQAVVGGQYDLRAPVILCSSYYSGHGSVVDFIQLSLVPNGLGYQYFYYGDDIVNSGGTVTTQSPYAMKYYTGPFRNPPGNHLNAVNIPQRDSKAYGIYCIWQNSLAPSGPTTYPYSKLNLTAYYDNFLTSDLLTDTTLMPRIRIDNTSNGNQSLDYYPIDRNCLQVNFQMAESASTNGINLYALDLTFDPQFGAS